MNVWVKNSKNEDANRGESKLSNRFQNFRIVINYSRSQMKQAKVVQIERGQMVFSIDRKEVAKVLVQSALVCWKSELNLLDQRSIVLVPCFERGMERMRKVL